MTFDAMSNSPSHSQREYKEIWSENLVIYQKSLFSRHPCNYDHCVVCIDKNIENNKNNNSYRSYQENIHLSNHFCCISLGASYDWHCT